ncbi:MAG TPA: hypothetical protein VGW38_21385 [Chloroflexota bacterium]|nr:hypothetical protein [Chloroflexota bacterium]
MAGEESWERQTVEQQPTGFSLWGWWIVATAAGWGLAGGLIGAFVHSSGSPLQYSFLPLTALGQWLILRRHFAQASWWIVATTGGALVAGIAYTLILRLPVDQFGPATSGARIGLSTIFDGLALAVAQWLVLRGNVPGTRWWIPADAGPLWFFAALELDRGTEAAELLETLNYLDQIALAATSLGIVGAMVGMATGGVLMWLVQQPRMDELNQ